MTSDHLLISSNSEIEYQKKKRDKVAFTTYTTKR